MHTVVGLASLVLVAVVRRYSSPASWSGLAVGRSPLGQCRPRRTVTTITLQGTHYKPKAPPGGTDDYHCTLVNPHVTKNSFIVASHFYPNSVEVHHAILFLVPPDLATTAVGRRQGGKGWTCFGESRPAPGTGPVSQISQHAVAHGLGARPRARTWSLPGTGVALPAGSLVVMQIHYNLLRGDKPVRAKLRCTPCPPSTPLQPLTSTCCPHRPTSPARPA